MRRLCIAGLKLDHPLALVDWAAGPSAALTAWTEALASARLNLKQVLAWPAAGSGGRCLACLNPAAADQAFDLAQNAARDFGTPPPELIRPVAALTIYPLAGDAALPLTALALLHSSGCTPLAVSTSMSAAVLVVPHEQRKPCLDLLARRFELPPSASPPESRVEVTQSPRPRDPD
jgi:hypothetical protein